MESLEATGILNKKSLDSVVPMWHTVESESTLTNKMLQNRSQSKEKK